MASVVGRLFGGAKRAGNRAVDYAVGYDPFVHQPKMQKRKRRKATAIKQMHGRASGLERGPDKLR